MAKGIHAKPGFAQLGGDYVLVGRLLLSLLERRLRVFRLLERSICTQLSLALQLLSDERTLLGLSLGG